MTVAFDILGLLGGLSAGKGSSAGTASASGSDFGSVLDGSAARASDDPVTTPEAEAPEATGDDPVMQKVNEIASAARRALGQEDEAEASGAEETDAAAGDQALQDALGDVALDDATPDQILAAAAAAIGMVLAQGNVATPLTTNPAGIALQDLAAAAGALAGEASPLTGGQPAALSAEEAASSLDAIVDSVAAQLEAAGKLAPASAAGEGTGQAATDAALTDVALTDAALAGDADPLAAQADLPLAAEGWTGTAAQQPSRAQMREPSSSAVAGATAVDGTAASASADAAAVLPEAAEAATAQAEISRELNLSGRTSAGAEGDTAVDAGLLTGDLTGGDAVQLAPASDSQQPVLRAFAALTAAPQDGAAQSATAAAGTGGTAQNRAQGLTETVTAQIRTADISNGQTRIELHPRGLGSLEIHLKSAADGSLNIVMRAENPVVLDALRNDRGVLSDLLAESGVQMDSAQMSFEQSGGREDSSAQAEAASAAAVALTGADEADGPTGGSQTIGSGALDILT